MNCKKGDIAFIKTTHPHRHLHGLMVECIALVGDFDGEVDVWFFKFAGGKQLDDEGVAAQDGYIQDRYLRPIRPSQEVTSQDRDVVTA